MEIELLSGTYQFTTNHHPMLWDNGTADFRIKAGTIRLHTRPNIAGYAVEIKDEPSLVSGTHFGIECTVDAKPSTATSQAGIRGGGFIGRLKATYTMTGGSLVGGYSQVCNLGTLNGATLMAAGHYTLVEDGGTWTAVNHLAGHWIDSHLAQTVSAGKKSFVYITNNGTIAWDNVFYIYPGAGITNLFQIDETDDTGLVGDEVDADYTFAHYVKIKMVAGGKTRYLIADADA